MPRRERSRSVKSANGWASRSDQLARAFAPFATDPIARVASGKSSQGVPAGHTRIAVAANLHDVLGLQAFAQPLQAAANQEVDDALLMPFI